MDKVKTGIKGFDRLVQGGFPRGKIILLSGTPGTCKTIFGLEFLYNGAVKFNEKGLYISFEERVEALRDQALQFGWDLKKLEQKGKIQIISIPAKTIEERTASKIIQMAKDKKVRRLVIDSLSAIAINTPSTYSKSSELTDTSIKRFIYNFINDLRDVKNDVTSLLISQTKDDNLSRDGVSEFISDGIIKISYEILGGEFPRTLTVRKMRETKNDEDIHPLKITNKGLSIKTYKE